MNKRRRFSAEFKARVALEVLSGAQTLAELAAKHDVHRNMISQWARKAQESLPDVFAPKADCSMAACDADLKEHHAKIGKVIVANDNFFKSLRPLSHGRRVATV